MGTAQVMGYEDLVAKRAEREAKEQAKANVKGKRGRKRKNRAEADGPDADEPEQGVPEPAASNQKGTSGGSARALCQEQTRQSQRPRWHV